MHSRPLRPLAVLPLLLVLSACAPAQQTETATEQPTDAAAGLTQYALCAPILPDKLDAWKAMIEQMKTDHDVHVAANAEAGITKELVWLQETPDGAAAVVYFEGRDLAGMMELREQAQDEHTRWFMSQIREVHPLPESMDQMPVNRMVFKGDVDGVEGEMQPYAMAAPILPGKEAAHAALCAEMAGPRHDMWMESRRALGIAKEYAWNQQAPDGSWMTVVYMEVADPAKLSAPAEGEFETWFRQQLLDIHGIPVDAPMPANTLAGVW